MCPRKALEEETFDLDLEKQAGVSLGGGGEWARKREKQQQYKACPWICPPHFCPRERSERVLLSGFVCLQLSLSCI